MKYNTLPKLMWTCYKSSFKKCLTTVLNESNPALVMKEAHKKYKEILSNVPQFDKNDRFIINILNCALLSSVLLSLENKYSLEEIRKYYQTAMCENFFTKKFSKKRRSYTVKGRQKLKEQAERSMKIENP